MRKVTKIFKKGYATPRGYEVYENIPVKKQKIVETRRGIKTVDYSPINYYGKQTRTVKKSWK